MLVEVASSTAMLNAQNRTPPFFNRLKLSALNEIFDSRLEAVMLSRFGNSSVP